MSRMNQYINALPEPARNVATSAWKGYGGIVLSDLCNEIVTVSDEYETEHVELHASRDQWYSNTLKNYSFLFVG